MSTPRSAHSSSIAQAEVRQDRDGIGCHGESSAVDVDHAEVDAVFRADGHVRAVGTEAWGDL